MNDLTASLQADQLEIWNESLTLAKACDFEVGHSFQVIRLALRLFDELAPMHQLGSQERFRLLLAGLLHDIGWAEGWKRHHKTSLNIILTSPMLSFDHRERLLIGSICRYHRGALPNLKHDHFSSLDEKDRLLVTQLSAILRIADSLDRTHRDIIRDLKADIDKDTIRISCHCSAPAGDEQHEGMNKGDLLEITYHRKLIIEWTIK